MPGNLHFSTSLTKKIQTRKAKAAEAGSKVDVATES